MVLYRDCYLKYFYMEFKLFILYFVHHEYAIAISGKGKSIHFSLCVKHHATKTYAGVLISLTSALDRLESSASCSDHFMTGDVALVAYWTGG